MFSEWLNADDKEMNEASVKWQQKHRHIKEPTIEETMKRLRLKDDVSSKYEKTPKININLLKQRITRRLCQASGDNLINQVQSFFNNHKFLSEKDKVENLTLPGAEHGTDY